MARMVVNAVGWIVFMCKLLVGVLGIGGCGNLQATTSQRLAWILSAARDTSMAVRYVTLLVLSVALAVLGYFLFGVVVAIYVGLWLHDEKMYYAQGLSAHLFGATGSAIGALLAWAIWRLGVAVFARYTASRTAEPPYGLFDLNKNKADGPARR
jgi:hypothetical protein